MARHIGIQFFMACAAAMIGCTSEQAVQPIAYNPPALDSAASDTVVFTPSPYGWEPAVGNVKAGGIVVWRTDKIYLLDMNYAVLDSLYWNNGLITHTFAAPGAYRFCSGGCWEPPEFGIIYSH